MYFSINTVYSLIAAVGLVLLAAGIVWLGEKLLSKNGGPNT
jgi:hypothetical protein